MLKFTPREIQNQEFKKVIRGYDPVEVETFLEIISDEFELLLRVKSDLREKVTIFETELKKYKEVEGSLHETLIEAKRTSSQSLETSKREAETIIRDAESKAQKIVEDAHRQMRRLQDEISMLKTQRESFVRRLKEWVKVLDLDEQNVEESEDVERRKRKGSDIENLEIQQSIESESVTTQVAEKEDPAKLAPSEDTAVNAQDVQSGENDLPSESDSEHERERAPVEPDTPDSGAGKVSQIHDGFNMIDKIIDEEEEQPEDEKI